MKCCPYMRRGLLLLALGTLLASGMIGLSLLGRALGVPQKDRPAKADKAGGKAAAWPMFGGTPQRNMVNLVDRNLLTEWKVDGPAKNIKWEAKAGTKAYGGPVIADGKVYVATNNDVPRDPKVKGPKAVLMCFAESDGKFLWQLAHDMPPAEVAREATRDGLCGTPTVDGKRLYYVTPACVVICASTDGKVLWSFDMMKKLKVYPCYLNSCSPLVVGDRVFVVTGNGRDSGNELPAAKAPSFIALTKKGELAWKDSSPGNGILEGQWSNPSYGVVNGKPQVIFPGGDGWLYAFEPKKGKLIWKFDCNPKDAEWKGKRGKVTRTYLIATPVVFANRVYVSTGIYPDSPRGNNGPGHLWCVDMTKTGDVSSELVVDAKATPPRTKPNPKSALVWHFGGEIKPRPPMGREVILGQSISTCAVHGGLVYAAEYQGYLHCLDANTGREYWQHDFKSAIWGSPYWVDDKVYVGDEDSDVVIFDHGKQKKVLGQIEMGESVLGTPVAAKGVLYVLTKSKLYAIARKKK